MEWGLFLVAAAVVVGDGLGFRVTWDRIGAGCSAPESWNECWNGLGWKGPSNIVQSHPRAVGKEIFH